MKKQTIWLLALMFICSLALSVGFIAGAESGSNEETVTVSDLVYFDGGSAEFKKIYPLFDAYNINKHSDAIDTKNTIDKVLVLGTESSNTVFKFKTHLNRDNLTKYFNIVEWFIVPTKLQPYGEPNYGNEFSDADFDSFEITIKDVGNPEKYVVFRTSNRPDANAYCTTVSGRAGANGQSVEGILHSDDANAINKNWGTSLKASHVGCFSDYDGVPTGFSRNLPLGGFVSLDYETKQVFSVTGAENGKRILVKDLDDGRYMTGTDIPWDGFDSKELEVSIRFINIVSGRTAQVAILGFNGVDFTKSKVMDNIAPEVIESTVLDEPALYGEVGRAMPITECYAYDLLDGFIYDVNYNVYYNYNSAGQTEKIISGGRFTPDKSGVYSIVATASDRFGNIGKHVRTVEIRKAINDLHLKLYGELPSECKVGERVALPSAFVYGGSVNKRYEISVLADDKAVETDAKDYFVPTKQGVYTVRYAVSDYYDDPVFFDYTVVASIDDKPIAYFPDLPKVVETGVKFVIPKFSAIDYRSFGDAVAADLSFAVKEPQSEEYKLIDGDFVPTVAGDYKLKITASCIADATKCVFKEYDFTAKDCRLVRDFFIPDGVSVENRDGDTAFVLTERSGSFYFLNPVISDEVKFEFSAQNHGDHAPAVIITLRDSVKKENAVSMRIEKSTAESSVLKTSNGSATIRGAVSDGNATFDLSYSKGYIYDGKNAVVKLNYYDNDNEFEGFSSGKVFVDFAIENSVDETVIKFLSFCGNQDFAYDAADITEPTVVYSDLGRICGIGEE
ncbi:MAG TPA: hypothetical protein DDW54_00400, partial [Clostridiales bacterium]|nr:hypothetical protein [Clostridiales bacterium]